MIRATVTNTHHTADGEMTDVVFKLETDAPYNPDAAEDLAARALKVWNQMQEGGDELTDRLAAAEPEPPRGPYLVRGCVGGTEHDWHTIERGTTFWCPECDAERPARA